MVEVRSLSTGHSLLEAPRWRDGYLYVSDFFTQRVLKFDETGSYRTVCNVPGMPSGLGWTPEGDLLIVSMTDRALWRLDGDELRQVADLSGLAPWHCNDMVVDHRGRAYVGNFGWDESSSSTIVSTSLIVVNPDGSFSTTADDVVFPNGMVITPDGGTLLVAETFASRITAFNISPDGQLVNRRVWASFSEEEFLTTTRGVETGMCLPDGIALDSDRCLWVADANGGGVLRVREGGEVLQRIPIDEGQTGYAVAMGGADLRTLFICAAAPYSTVDVSKVHTSRLLSCRVDVAGVPAW